MLWELFDLESHETVTDVDFYHMMVLARAYYAYAQKTTPPYGNQKSYKRNWVWILESTLAHSYF
eukprot:5751159-Amphidinium_carterae.1